MSEQENNPSAQGQGKKMDVYADFPPEVKIRTKKMMMYLIIFAVVMLFAGLTSIILVLNGKNYWVHVYPPKIMWLSNLLVVLSSTTLLLALYNARRDRRGMTAALVVITFLLGIGFTITQTTGWKQLKSLGMGYTITEIEPGVRQWHWNSLDMMKGEYGVDYDIRKSGQVLISENGELYLPTDVQREKPVTSRVAESFNTAGAMIAILVYLHIFHLCLGLIYLLVLTYRTLKGRIGSTNWISLHAGGMYWHFMGILWVYLFFFLFYLQ